ncbi:CDP-glycerol glycerophosphotransferase family protein [Candidatus Woesearchaeota archaeon]|nr:CDP-glycerol glycerophosphotransferase family protein [Candidatus Woesearchaeota archaeon]
MKIKANNCDMINVLVIQWMNKKDLAPLREYIKNKDTKIRLVNFDEVYSVKYDYQRRFLRYWSQLKRFNLKKLGIYFNFIINSYIKKNYSYSFDNVRKLAIMGLSFKDYNKIIKNNNIRAIMIYRDDPWLNNIILFSKRIGIKVIILNNEHVFGESETTIKVVKSLPCRGDLILVGGESGKKYWSHSIGINKEKIKIVGVSRFDAYQSKGYMSRSEFCNILGLDQKKKIVFFPSFINQYDLYVYGLTKSSLTMTYKPEDLDFCWPIKETINVNMEKYKEDKMKLLFDIAKENKNIQIIIKLHPDQQANEEHCVKHELMAMNRVLPNFVGIPGIPNRITAPDIIINSDVIVGHGSTMLLEAIIANKTILPTQWDLPNNEFRLPIIERKTCEDVTGKDMFKKKLFKILRDGEDVKRFEKGRKELIEYYFGKQDGQSCERIVKEIEKEFSNAKD